MSLPAPVLNGGYPNDPSNPSPYRCTISRPMGPRAREHRYNPFSNAFHIESSKEAIRDLFSMQRLVAERVITFPSTQYVRMGKVAKHCTAATISVSAFDPSVAPPAIVPAATLASLLEPVTTVVFANGRNIYPFSGPPTFGVTFAVDIRAGELVYLAVQNTRLTATPINGLQLRWQLFLYSDPEYAIEMARKGRPGPIA